MPAQRVGHPERTGPGQQRPSGRGRPAGTRPVAVLDGGVDGVQHEAQGLGTVGQAALSLGPGSVRHLADAHDHRGGRVDRHDLASLPAARKAPDSAGDRSLPSPLISLRPTRYTRAMRIAVGSDHAGYALKSEIIAHLTGAGHDVLDLGTDSAEVSVDYPTYGRAVGEAVADGRAERGVCVCGSGIGIGIAANKVPGVRAAVVHDTTTAVLARRHNDANVRVPG